jgi:hypothetical protein
MNHPGSFDPIAIHIHIQLTGFSFIFNIFTAIIKNINLQYLINNLFIYLAFYKVQLSFCRKIIANFSNILYLKIFSNDFTREDLCYP